MEELSIEEKAKRYDEAIEIAKEINNEQQAQPFNVMTRVFPELAESEDELHRKWILEYLYDGLRKSDEQFKDQFKCAIAWFEKQGEHANFRNKIKIGDKVTRNKDGVLVNLSQLKRVSKKDEKQGKNNMGISEATKRKLEDNLNKALEKETPESWNKFLDEQGEQKPAEWQKAKDESATEDLGGYINELFKQFPEVSFAKLSRIAVRVSRWQRNQDTKNKLPEVINRTDLDEYAYQCAYDMSNDWMIENPTWHDVENACKLGAKWQKENLWKSANGDDLPEYDREVIVLINYNAQCNIHDEEYPTYRVGFGHRPNPDGWDGKNIDTNEVTHYTPKLYDKGGWNAPNIVYWLDTRLPYEEK